MKHLNPLNIFSLGFDMALNDLSTSGCNPPTNYCGARDCRQPCSGCSDTYKWSCDVDECKFDDFCATPTQVTGDMPCKKLDICYGNDYSDCNVKDKCNVAGVPWASDSGGK